MPRGVRAAGVKVKRRRIREIVASSLEDYTGEPATAAEIIITTRKRVPRSRCVSINVLWAVAVGPSKREAMQAALVAHKWVRTWPRLTSEEYVLNRTGPGLDRLWSDSPSVRLAHLREPVALP